MKVNQTLWVYSAYLTLIPKRDTEWKKNQRSVSKFPVCKKKTTFGDVGVVYLDSVENFGLICSGFRSSLTFKFFLNRKGALCQVGDVPDYKPEGLVKIGYSIHFSSHEGHG